MRKWMRVAFCVAAVAFSGGVLRAEEVSESGLILFVGTLCEKKGIRQLIQAMAQIVAAVPHARLLVVGRDTRDPHDGGPFSAALKRLVPDELQGRITFAGPVAHSAIPDVLARASVCVYPSHMEALPLAWLEAMAMGKALVASRTGPGPELVEDGLSGLLCDPHDPDSIADRVIAVLKDAELRRRLGVAARRRVVVQFSTDAVMSQVEDFYSRALASRRSGSRAQS